MELTERETSILQMIAADKTVYEMATILHVSESMIQYHLHELFEKFHVWNYKQLLHYAKVPGRIDQS